MEIGNFDLMVHGFDISEACECLDSEPNVLPQIIEISTPFIEKLPVLWHS